MLILIPPCDCLHSQMEQNSLEVTHTHIRVGDSTTEGAGGEATILGE